MTRTFLAVLGIGCFAAATAVAQEAQAPAAEEPKEEPITREEQVVVTASKYETQLINAPATISVVTSEALATAPSSNFGDLLRSVPGVNVIQMSARDVNLSSRKATSTLETSQLVLLDGRTMYLDFFGLVLWDLVPTNPSEIKQIEVVRGPASAVWGANALSGVVNIITKSPREAKGTYIALSGGSFNRDDGSREADGSGYSFGGNISIARAQSERFSYRLAAGYFDSDPYSRPVGQIALIADPRVAAPVCSVSTVGGVQVGTGANCVGGGFYPIDGTGAAGTAFENGGTKQPKVDLRVDQDFTDGGRVTYSAGYAGTEGIVHTGIGPFRIESPSYMAYGRVAYSKGALKVSGFGNFLDVEAPNLLLIDPAALPAIKPVQLNFKTQTFDFEVGHSKVLGGKHILSYGGNARRNNFDITLTPNAEDRNEFGAYFQEEYFLDKFRVSAGIRVDKFGNIDKAVFSPRATAMFKPAKDHAIRVSYNKAFRSPSAVNNFLDQDIFSASTVDLRGLVPFAPPALRPALSAPFRLRVKSAGSEVVVPRYNLQEESVTAFEIGYTGTFRERTTVGIALYQNDSDNNINFATLLPNASFRTGLPGFDVYTAANAPPIIGVGPNGPVPGAVVPFLDAVRRLIPTIPRLPRTAASYLNLGPLRQRGVEVSLDHRVNDVWNFALNYSWQGEPDPLEPDADQLPYLKEEISLPPTSRFNASVAWNSKRFAGSAGVNYSDKAFWSDVLTSEFHGFTESYTMVNANFGVKWSDGKVVTSIKGTNLLNEKIQQHVFGDILKRSVVGEVRFTF